MGTNDPNYPIPDKGIQEDVGRTLITLPDGTAITAANPLPTTAVISGDVTVDIDEVNAELKVDSGHDLYKANSVLGDASWTVTFTSISGLVLNDIQGLENKTTGEVYNTAGATVTATSLALVSGNNTGKIEPQVTDSLELIYRGTSRFDTQATETTLDAVKIATEATQVSVELIDDAIGTPDSTAATKNIQVGAVAETTVPSAVADGDNVNPNFNEYGDQRIAGYNYSVNAVDNNIVNQALLNTSESVDLSAVTADGASTEMNAINFNKLTYHIISSLVTSGATIELQHSLTGDTNTWATISTTVVSADGVNEVVIENRKYKYIRVEVKSRVDGTYTVRHLWGN